MINQKLTQINSTQLQTEEMNDSSILYSSHKKRSHTEPHSNSMSLQNNRNQDYKNHMFPKKNSLNQFHDQLNKFIKAQSRRAKNIQYNKRIYRNAKAKKQAINLLQIDEIKSNIKQLKNNIISNKQKKQLTESIDKALYTIVQKKYKQKPSDLNKSVVLPYISSYPQQNINSPQPMIPYFPPPPHPAFFFRPDLQREHNKQQQSQSQQQKQKKPRKMSRNEIKVKKKIDKIVRQKNKIRLKKILKKVFLAVTYLSYLKKLVKNIMIKKKTIFNKIWPSNFQKSINGMRKWFSTGCRPFFEEMAKKSQVQLQIQGDESSNVLDQKKKTIKKLIKILIVCISRLVENQSFSQIIKISHIFCKHGSLIQNGVLTPQQLQIVCISEANGYLRMDCALEKSQLINFLFMKLIIYNLLLQPWKYNQKIFNINENKQSYENFYYISSVFYQILLSIQDNFLESNHEQHIQIGNWRKLKSKFKIKCSPSLCHLESNYQNGQMISGLVSQNLITSVFSNDFWDQEIKSIQQIIQTMHAKLRDVHANFINEVYDYKKKNQR